MLLTNKLKIYETLFSHPLFNYAADNKISVLITGDNTIALEAFKAVFWCGQMPEYKLTITLSVPDPDSFKAKLFARMPALTASSDYAKIDFTEHIPTDKKYSCIFDCDPSEDLSGLSDLLVVFDSAATALCKEESSKITFTTDEAELTDPDFVRKIAHLERLAFNIHFSYALNSNQRTSKNAEKQNFYQEYNYISSCASAVHIPYKLQICPADKLVNAIETKNDDYNKLLKCEHNRWLAYQITEGYRMPTYKELEEYAYLGGNDHRNKTARLHPCMCKCGDRGITLSNPNSDIWSQDITTLNKLSQLDRVSVKLHQIASARAEEVIADFNNLVSFIDNIEDDDLRSSFYAFKNAVQKLFDDEENSVLIYKNGLNLIYGVLCEKVSAVTGCTVLSPDDAHNKTKAIEKLEYIDKLFDSIAELDNRVQIVIVRNTKTDFFSNDAQLISLLPFCLWYDDKYSVVVTFSNNFLYEDIIVPTLLCPDKAIFYGSDVENDIYTASCKSYFANRGNNASLIIQNKTFSDVSEAIEILNSLIATHGKNLVVNCVNNTDMNMLIAIGSVCINKGIPVVKYNGDNITNFNTEKLLIHNDMSITLDEFMVLMGGRYSNLYKNLSVSYTDLKGIEALFWNTSEEKFYYNAQGGRKHYNTWSGLSPFLMKACKDEKANLKGATFSEPQKALLEYTPDTFDNRNLREFLYKLNMYRIISDLAIHTLPDKITVEFNYIDEGLLTYLSDSSYGTLKLTFPKGISYSVLDTQCDGLYDSNDSDVVRREKINFFKKMSQLGLISQLKQEEDNVAFTFKNQIVKDILRIQGKPLELIIFRQMRESGFFSEVQTNVEIQWETNNQTYQALLKEYTDSGYTSCVGYDTYQKVINQVTFDTKNDNSTANEIDVIGMRGFTPYFVSCKTGKYDNIKTWINEIASLAARFNAVPILAISHDLDGTERVKHILRAQKMGVSIIGRETLTSTERFNKAMKMITSGNAVIGSETK